MVSSVSFLALALLVLGSDAFSMKMSSSDSRRAFLGKIAATTAAVTASVVAPSPALAVGGKNKVNTKLLSFGLPPAVIPEGLSPLCHIYGKGKNRFPILVTFAHPFDWVVSVPNNDANGEEGTISAGEYGKGDSATFFLYEEPGNVKVSKEVSVKTSRFSMQYMLCIHVCILNMHMVSHTLFDVFGTGYS